MELDEIGSVESAVHHTSVDVIDIDIIALGTADENTAVAAVDRDIRHIHIVNTVVGGKESGEGHVVIHLEDEGGVSGKSVGTLKPSDECVTT